MRAAIIHYWLLNMRGGEKVVEALCRMLPDADLFTLFYDPERVSETIRGRRVTASYLNPLRRHYRSLLPLMPMALESFDLRGYDLIVSSESGPAKGVLAPSTARHVCYCHTPMRYLWDLYPAYRNEWTASGWKRTLMAPLANYLRLWDYSTAARVDEFVANSANVARRIWKTYRREAGVIYPPVNVESFYWKEAEDYYHYAVIEMADWGSVDRMMAIKNLTPQTLGDKVYAEKRMYFASRAIGGYPLVGSPDHIADELADLSRSGVRGIAFSMINYLNELPLFRDEVLPRLERHGVRAAHN